MTNNHADATSVWSPLDWHTWRDWFPQTPPLDSGTSQRNAEFINIWNSQCSDKRLPEECDRNAGRILFVLARGLFGNLMPGNFVAIRNHLDRSGAHVIRTTIRPAGTVEQHAQFIADESLRTVHTGERIVFLCQSKGGLDTLWALKNTQHLREKTAGVILMQTPSGASQVLESVVSGRHAGTLSGPAARTIESLKRSVLKMPFLSGGAHQLIEPDIQDIVAAIRSFDFQFPVISVATWSNRPTSWVDSFHERLNEIRPGAAHDGQFFLEDQLWPEYEQLLLGHIDHAQPVMGGGGFDPVPLWTCLVHLLFEIRREKYGS